MKYVIDTHTHTIVSGHAYTTLLENVKEAANKGIKLLGTTDHGPNMPGGPNLFHFGNFKAIPRQLYGVKLIHGCEANILDYEGTIDIPVSVQQKLDIIIVSLHEVCIVPGTKDENTKALLKVMDNPYVDIIAHSGNPAFPIWEEQIIKKAKEKDILIEINNGSFAARRGSEVNCTRIAQLCKEYQVKVILGSDAHTCFSIGDFSKVEKIIQKIGMPQELIVNNDEKKLINYLKKKGKLQDLNLD